jgi:hypothetical protein
MTRSEGRRSRYIRRANLSISGFTGFILLVYDCTDMAKETVGFRIPIGEAQQVDSYAEAYEITRTEAVERFVRAGFDAEGEPPCKQEYLLVLPPQFGSVHGMPSAELNAARKHPLRVLSRKLRSVVGDPEESEEEKALTARLPPELVEEIVEWGQSEELPKSVAAEKLVRRGLWSDPAPDEGRDGLEGQLKTFDLGPDTADMFRRYRYRREYTPQVAAYALWRHVGTPEETEQVPIPDSEMP